MDETKEKAAEEPKKVWRVVHSGIQMLEATLNELAADSYQVFKIDYLNAGWIVVAFDPALLGAKTAEAFTKSLNAIALGPLASQGMPIQK